MRRCAGGGIKRRASADSEAARGGDAARGGVLVCGGRKTDAPAE